MELSVAEFVVMGMNLVVTELSKRLGSKGMLVRLLVVNRDVRLCSRRPSSPSSLLLDDSMNF